MPFQIYERRSRPSVTDPVMAIQSRGMLSFNSAAFELIRDHRPDDEETWGELLYDPDEDIVAVRAVKPGSGNSYPIRKQKLANSYLMTAKGFLAYHKIPIGQVRHYRIHEFGDGIVGFSRGEDELSRS